MLYFMLYSIQQIKKLIFQVFILATCSHSLSFVALSLKTLQNPTENWAYFLSLICCFYVQVWQCSGKSKVRLRLDAPFFKPKLSETAYCQLFCINSVVQWDGLTVTPFAPARPPCMWHRFMALSTDLGVWIRFTFGEAGCEYSCKPWNAFVCFAG